MKKILILIGFLYSLNSFSQSTVLLRGDTIRVYKQGGDAVLKVDSTLMLDKYFAGASTDSVLSWDAVSRKIRMRNASSFSGGGTGTDNTNLGSFYRLLVPSSQGIKGIAPGYGTLWDSTTNANSLTSKFDSATVFNQLKWSRILENEKITAGYTFYYPTLYRDLDINMNTNKWFIDNANDFAVNLNTNEFAISGNNGSFNTNTIISSDVDHQLRILSGRTSGRYTDMLFYPDSLIFRLDLGSWNIDTIRNGSTYNVDKIIGWGQGNGVVGYITPSYGLILSSGLLKVDTSALATQYDLTTITPSLTSTQIAYGSGGNTITSEAALTYNATDNILDAQYTRTQELLLLDFNSISTPASGYVGIYSDSHGRVYSKNDAGTVVELTNVAATNGFFNPDQTSSANTTHNAFFKTFEVDNLNTYNLFAGVVASTNYSNFEMDSLQYQLSANKGSAFYNITAETANDRIFLRAFNTDEGNISIKSDSIVFEQSAGVYSFNLVPSDNAVTIVYGEDAAGHLVKRTVSSLGGVSDGDKGDITVSSSGTVWVDDYKRQRIYSNVIGTDANISAIAGTSYALPAATLSTNRTIDMTNLNTNGDYIEFDNQEAGFTWTFTGQTVYDAYENSVTVLLTNTRYIIRRTNGKLKIIN